VKSKTRKVVTKGTSLGPKITVELEDSLVVSGPKAEPEVETGKLGAVQVEAVKQEDL